MAHLFYAISPLFSRPGAAFSTEPCHQNFIVFFNVVQTTVIGDECGDFLAVLNKLNPDALSDGRVRLLGFNTNFFQDDSLGVGSTSEGVGLPSGSKVGLLEVVVGPPLLTPVVDVLTRSTNTTCNAGGGSMSYEPVCQQIGLNWSPAFVTMYPGPGQLVTEVGALSDNGIKLH